MTAVRLVSKLLKFKGFRAVSFWFEDRGRELVIAVKPDKNGCRCPECNRRGKIVHALPPRRWRDVRVCGRRVWLLYSQREIRCPTHGRRVEKTPWAAPSARVSYRFEYVMLRYCRAMPQAVAAQLLGVAPSTLSDILHRVIERQRQGHKIRGLITVGIDEISYAKRHKYATVVYDLERSCVVWVGRGRARKTIDRFFGFLSPYQKAKIKWACCDMSEAFIGAIGQHCPNAQLVLDRFHVVKAINDAVDEVRKEQWRDTSRTARKALKGLRWLLYRHSSTRSRQDTQTLKALEKGNRRIYRAWRLKDEFEQLWEYRSPKAAKAFLKRWTTTALKSRLEPLRKFVRTVRKHDAGILAFVDRRLTNAVAEGINRIIRLIKNRASGFRSLDAFADMIFLCVGDLDIPAQIPARFRTL
jgi:transposase